MSLIHTYIPFDSHQFQCKDWKARTPELEKQLKLRNEPWIKDEDDILLPSLHMKLGRAGKFVEVVEDSYDCLKTIFSKLIEVKIRKGTLNGPKIQKLMKSESFTNILSKHYNHLCAWETLKQVIKGVLAKNLVQRDDIQTRVDKLLYYFEKINASMTLKLNFMHFHLDTFLAQLPQESDEQGERFHQLTMLMEKRFKGKK